MFWCATFALCAFCDYIHSCSSVNVSDVLWNLHSYYKQFIPCIEQSIQEMRKPIEKDLKVSNCNMEKKETHYS